MERKKFFKAYAIVSAYPLDVKTSSKLRSVISKHGKSIENGVVITPHGIDNVLFFEISDENSQIVYANL